MKLLSGNFLAACLAAGLSAALLSCGGEKAGEETLLLYAKASSEYARGNFDKAAAMLAGTGDFGPALVLRGKALYFCDSPEEAENAFNRALKLQPRSAEASLFLARIFRDQGKDDEARKAAELLIRDNPEDVRALRLRADLALQDKDVETAAALLDRAVEGSMETALVFVDRARLRWIGGNAPGALEDLGRAEALLGKDSYLSSGIRELRFRIASAGKTREAAEMEKREKTEEGL
jgi:tetratricopeptide (TPR) repeat protein